MYEWKKYMSGFTTGQAQSTGIPCAMALTACIVRAPVRPALCHLHLRIIEAQAWHLPPGARPTRFCRPHHAARLAARWRAASNVRDDREAPLVRKQNRRIKPLILESASSYFDENQNKISEYKDRFVSRLPCIAQRPERAWVCEFFANAKA
jgi:hypothetical protein